MKLLKTEIQIICMPVTMSRRSVSNVWVGSDSSRNKIYML